MPIFEKWYKRKKPTLQIRILKIIAREGESSKIKLQESVNAHYPDVSDAVESLKKERIIEQSRVDFAKGRRPEIYYKLTKRGLEAVINEFSDPEIFWSTIISYCILNKYPLSPKEFDKYYRPFETKYLGYRNAHEFFFQVDFMDELFEKWNSIHDDGPITIPQKVLECIALHPSITLEQIIKYLEPQETKYEQMILEQHRKRTKNPKAQFSPFMPNDQVERYQSNRVSEENIIRVLKGHTLSSSYSLDQFSRNSEPSEIRAQYLDFIRHMLINVSEDETGKKLYKLTLFGVVLILATVYRYYRVRDKVFFNEYLEQDGNNSYYSRVALNYKDKLPLIFGKWKLLTDIFFGVGYLMRNFEPVFSKEIRVQLISLPLTMGGIKELYENMRGLAYHRYSKLTEIYESGEAAIDRISEADLSRISQVEKRLFEIDFLLGSADLRRFIGYLAEQNFNSFTKTNVLTSIENSFANELSFLFYINLTTKFAYLPQFRDEHVIPSMLYDYMITGNEQRRFVKPRQILTSVLECDDEIRERFSAWYKDSISYEKQIINYMHDLQSEVGLSLDS